MLFVNLFSCDCSFLCISEKASTFVEALVFYKLFFVYFLVLPIVFSNFKLGKWDASYELLCFLEFVYFLVHYRSCSYQDQGHFFWGIYPAPSLPTGSRIVHPPDFIYVSPGKVGLEVLLQT